MSRIAKLLPLALAWPVVAAAPPPTVPAPPASYADLIDLSLGAPVVARVTVRQATKLSPVDAPGVRPGSVRFYVTADLEALIRGGAGGLPPSLVYLVDVPLDSRGKPPRLKGASALLFAEQVAGRPGEIRLIAPDAERPADPEVERAVRAILTEALGPAAPPRITAVQNAFHVAGTLPGEGETQIFLRTDDHRPVSLSVTRRPGEEPAYAVALGDMIDEAAAAPARNTLLWYRLACALPQRLPDRSVADLSADDAEAARRDYRFVLDRLGPCGRLRGGEAQPGASEESVTPTASQSG